MKSRYEKRMDVNIVRGRYIVPRSNHFRLMAFVWFFLAVKKQEGSSIVDPVLRIGWITRPRDSGFAQCPSLHPTLSPRDLLLSRVHTVHVTDISDAEISRERPLLVWPIDVHWSTKSIDGLRFKWQTTKWSLFGHFFYFCYFFQNC